LLGRGLADEARHDQTDDQESFHAFSSLYARGFADHLGWS
jgi:hypothetical protein